MLYWFLYCIVFLVLGFETLNLKDLDYGISTRVLSGDNGGGLLPQLQ